MEKIKEGYKPIIFVGFGEKHLYYLTYDEGNAEQINKRLYEE